MRWFQRVMDDLSPVFQEVGVLCKDFADAILFLIALAILYAMIFL